MLSIPWNEGRGGSFSFLEVHFVTWPSDHERNKGYEEIKTTGKSPCGGTCALYKQISCTGECENALNRTIWQWALALRSQAPKTQAASARYGQQALRLPSTTMEQRKREWYVWLFIIRTAACIPSLPTITPKGSLFTLYHIFGFFARVIADGAAVTPIGEGTVGKAIIQ